RYRSGTLATYRALNILGFEAYHNHKSFAYGASHMKMFNEALQASWHENTEAYHRPEFDKWFQGYDALVELPSYFPEEIVQAYPGAKYILVERDPTAWARSVMNSIVRMAEDVNKMPIRTLKHFDETMKMLCINARLIGGHFSGGHFTRQGGLEACETCLLRVKKLVPTEQLLVLRLEDGLDWHSICPFLQLPLPQEPWPEKNTCEQFHTLVQELMTPLVKRALVRATTYALLLAVIVCSTVLSAISWWCTDQSTLDTRDL
ncbi:uncharacterized protein B0I36DRAFT_399295, partial [Microdochium trichocladiopsis]